MGNRPTGEVGPGCMADQLIGQWWAHQLGLGYILPKDKVRAALRSVFKYNWVPDLTGLKQAPWAFAGAGDKGLLICTWPKGGRPEVVMLYSDEVWTGVEYQVAAHMIYEGMTEEGLAIVRGARDRYDEGWGSLRQVRRGNGQRNEIHVTEGRLAVAQLRLVPPAGVNEVKVTLGGAAVDAGFKRAPDAALVLASLAAPAIVKAGETLTVELS